MSRHRRRIARSIRVIAASMALFGAPGAARAHATWSDGSTIPEWVTKACCGPSDAHHLRPDQVHRVDDGFLIDGYPKIVYDAQVLPSQDGDYWAFYSEGNDAGGRRLFTSVFCFFAPSWS